MRNKILLTFVAAVMLCGGLRAQELAYANPHHYWSFGVNSASKFFFATYLNGGSNIITLDASLTWCAGTNWRVGPGVGFGGGVSMAQRYLDEQGAEVGTNPRNPWVVPVFVRAKYLFAARESSSWFASMDMGYMLGLVKRHDDAATTYYGFYTSPSVGRQFGLRSSMTKVSVGIGVNFYLERREMEVDPFTSKFKGRLDFLGYITFDIGKIKRPKITVTNTTGQD